MFKRYNTVGELLTYLSTLPPDMIIHTETEVMNFEPGIAVVVEEMKSNGEYVNLPDEFDESVPVLLVDGRD
jgi:hypothetical protein